MLVSEWIVQMSRGMSQFDKDMIRIFRYHRRLVKLCCALAAINVDSKLFDKYAPKSLRAEKNNQEIRWKLEDQIRDLLRKNDDFPKKAGK
jgi:hypothetical protein